MTSIEAASNSIEEIENVSTEGKMQELPQVSKQSVWISKSTVKESVYILNVIIVIIN